MARPSGRLEPHHVPIRTGDSPTNPKPAAEEPALMTLLDGGGCRFF